MPAGEANVNDAVGAGRRLRRVRPGHELTHAGRVAFGAALHRLAQPFRAEVAEQIGPRAGILAQDAGALAASQQCSPAGSNAMSHTFMTVLALAATLASCAREEPSPREASEIAASAADTMSAAADAAADPTRAAALVQAAERVIDFLQGAAPFGGIRLADSVTLRLSPQGGGTQASLPRESLRDRANWAVPTYYGQQSLVPPLPLPHRTARSGVHFNCREYELAMLAPDWASFPHVGVRLAPHADPNCLQTWNLTLVFAPGDGPPLLVAAMYDQWEW